MRSCDAVLIAAFGDPGLAAIREIAPVPVVGIAEAAFGAARETGPRFSLVAISERIALWYRECAAINDVRGNLASIRTLSAPLRDIGSVQEDHEEALLTLCRRIVEEDAADAVVLAGAPLAGLGIADCRRSSSAPLVVFGFSSAACECFIGRAGSAANPAVDGETATTRPPLPADPFSETADTTARRRALFTHRPRYPLRSAASSVSPASRRDSNVSTSWLQVPKITASPNDLSLDTPCFPTCALLKQ